MALFKPEDFPNEQVFVNEKLEIVRLCSKCGGHNNCENPWFKQCIVCTTIETWDKLRMVDPGFVEALMLGRAIMANIERDKLAKEAYDKSKHNKANKFYFPSFKRVH